MAKNLLSARLEGREVEDVIGGEGCRGDAVERGSFLQGTDILHFPTFDNNVFRNGKDGFLSVFVDAVVSVDETLDAGIEDIYIFYGRIRKIGRLWIGLAEVDGALEGDGDVITRDHLLEAVVFHVDVGHDHIVIKESVAHLDGSLGDGQVMGGDVYFSRGHVARSAVVANRGGKRGRRSLRATGKQQCRKEQNSFFHKNASSYI